MLSSNLSKKFTTRKVVLWGIVFMVFLPAESDYEVSFSIRERCSCLFEHYNLKQMGAQVKIEVYEFDVILQSWKSVLGFCALITSNWISFISNLSKNSIWDLIWGWLKSIFKCKDESILIKWPWTFTKMFRVPRWLFSEKLSVLKVPLPRSVAKSSSDFNDFSTKSYFSLKIGQKFFIISYLLSVTSALLSTIDFVIDCPYHQLATLVGFSSLADIKLTQSYTLNFVVMDLFWLNLT